MKQKNKCNILQEKTNKIIVEIPLSSTAVLHASRDLIAFQIAKNNKNQDSIVYLNGFELQDVSEILRGETLDLHGYAVPEKNGLVENAIELATKPLEYGKHTGTFITQTLNGQAFAHTKHILTQGMCGGAVVSSSGHCIGMIEGIIPTGHPAAGDAGFVPTTCLRHAIDFPQEHTLQEFSTAL